MIPSPILLPTNDSSQYIPSEIPIIFLLQPWALLAFSHNQTPARNKGAQAPAGTSQDKEFLRADFCCFILPPPSQLEEPRMLFNARV